MSFHELVATPFYETPSSFMNLSFFQFFLFFIHVQLAASVLGVDYNSLKSGLSASRNCGVGYLRFHLSDEYDFIQETREEEEEGDGDHLGEQQDQHHEEHRDDLSETNYTPGSERGDEVEDYQQEDDDGDHLGEHHEEYGDDLSETNYTPGSERGNEVENYQQDDDDGTSLPEFEDDGASLREFHTS